MSSGNDLIRQIAQMKQCELLKESEVKDLCCKVREIMVEEPNVQIIYSPVTICGDIHGQFIDLIQLFKTGGDIPAVNYLFLGDYVDRGFNSVETLLLLLALKVAYPERLTLLRGNHESRQITMVYGFYDECLRKYGSLNVWRYISELFDYMSLAAIIEDKLICVHGGISQNILNIDDIRSIDRKQEVPYEGQLADILWSDPDEDLASGYASNPRGIGYLFSKESMDKFHRANNTENLIRSHQLVMEGYKQCFNEQCLTVWSAPNYCYRCGNIAAILEIDDNMQRMYKVFNAAPQEQRIVGTKKAALDYFL